ncbi:DUF5719 family protein [Nocardiopsis baichengensis]|uniref:DUF5719 family protein n=1 Tax=Nocardiopsis baichengensis TaxID=280240 RepID=UPI00034B8F43|nr:DUF5719 family protein [Nocardiopsis baichengensis]
MKLIVQNRFALLGLVAVALAALFAVAAGTRPAGPPEASGGGERVRVESAVRVCPSPPEDTGTEAAVFSPFEGDEEGELVLEPNEEDPRAPLAEGDLPGQLLAEDVDDAEGASVLRASGAFAAGLDAAVTARADDGDAEDDGAPGLAAVGCAEPGWSTWFTAPSGEDVRELRLRLANPDDSAAVATVDVYASDGPVSDSSVRGVRVEPHTEEVLELGELTEASSGDAATVHVRTSAGRVSPSLLVERSGPGTEWAPATARPAHAQAVPGVPGGGGARTLMVAAPGDEPAEVQVRLVTAEGEVEVEALETVDVPPASTTTASLDMPLGEQPATVVVESDEPVVAGVAAEREGGDDAAYTAAVPALAPGPNGTASVPAVPEGVSLDLLVGATEEDAVVVATPVSPDGTTGDPVQVEAGAGTTAEQEVEGPDGDYALALELGDGSGSAYVGAVLTEGSGKDRHTAVLPVHPAPSEVRLPAVTGGLTAISGTEEESEDR